MNINFSCINMAHSTYLKNYVENKLYEKIFLLICPPIEVDLTVRAVDKSKFIACETTTLDGALFFIEYAGSDTHQAIDNVVDRLVILLNHHETRLRARRNEIHENVIDLNAKRREAQHGNGPYRS